MKIIYNPNDMSIPALEAKLKETQEILDRKIKKRNKLMSELRRPKYERINVC